MAHQFQDRVARLKKSFGSLGTPEERYTYLMELGKGLGAFPAALRSPERIVPGCQSVLYLDVTLKDGVLEFAATSEALISKGLAALLIAVYGSLPPEAVLLNPPSFLEELGIFASLSPSRSNGLAQIYLRMQQEALKALS